MAAVSYRAWGLVFALAGVVGALVSVPTAALIAVLLEEYAVQKN